MRGHPYKNSFYRDNKNACCGLIDEDKLYGDDPKNNIIAHRRGEIRTKAIVNGARSMVYTSCKLQATHEELRHMDMLRNVNDLGEDE